MAAAALPGRLGAPALALYRNEHDSVAFHRDRELRWLDDTVIAVLTFGARRPWLMKPLIGRRNDLDDDVGAIDFSPGSGDLLVMGGTTQARWLHAVPKVRGRCRTRISVQWRYTSTTELATRTRRSTRRDISVSAETTAAAARGGAPRSPLGRGRVRLGRPDHRKLGAAERPLLRQLERQPPVAARKSQSFDDRGVGHAAALAHRLQAVAAAGALELVQQRRHQPRARSSRAGGRGRSRRR